MLHLNVIPVTITFLLLPQVFVHGGLWRELHRKFTSIFKPLKSRKPDPYFYNCNLCTFGPCTPMVWQPNNVYFDASVDVMTITTALQSFTDNDKANIEKILFERSAVQRDAIANAFLIRNKETILDRVYYHIKADTMARYYDLIDFMTLPLPTLYAGRFKGAMNLQQYDIIDQGHGQAMILEFLITLPKCLLDKAIEFYNSKSGQDLIPDINKALTLPKVNKSPEYLEVIKKLVEQNRDTNERVSWITALTFAYKLKSDVISQRESDMKERFSELFTRLSIPQAIETIIVYENLRHGDKEFKSLFDDIDKYKGSEKEIYKTMVRLLKNKPLYFAKEIESILKCGVRDYTYERRLIFLFAGRYDIDLKDIIVAYNHQSETGLRADFEAWDTDVRAKGFHPVILDIIDKASKVP